MGCEEEAVNWVKSDFAWLEGFVGELLAKDSEQVGWGNGGHVIDNNFQFFWEFVLGRVHFGGCQRL